MPLLNEMKKKSASDLVIFLLMGLVLIENAKANTIDFYLSIHY